MIPVSFSPDAEIELHDAAAFYDFECPGLGSDFLEDVMSAVGWIEIYPEHSVLLYGRVRSKLL